MDILHYGFTTWILIRRWIQKAKDKESNKPAQWEEKGVCEGKKTNWGKTYTVIHGDGKWIVGSSEKQDRHSWQQKDVREIELEMILEKSEEKGYTGGQWQKSQWYIARTNIIQHTHNWHHLGTQSSKENGKKIQREKANEETAE